MANILTSPSFEPEPGKGVPCNYEAPRQLIMPSTHCWREPRAQDPAQSTPRPGLRELPAHLPRCTAMHAPLGRCACAACRSGLREIRRDVSEVAGPRAGRLLHGAPRSSEVGIWWLPHDQASAGAEPAGGSVSDR